MAVSIGLLVACESPQEAEVSTDTSVEERLEVDGEDLEEAVVEPIDQETNADKIGEEADKEQEEMNDDMK